jgi:hypothetical protein
MGEKVDLRYNPLDQDESICIPYRPKKFLITSTQLGAIEDHSRTERTHIAMRSGFITLGMILVWVQYAFLTRAWMSFPILLVGYFMFVHSRAASDARQARQVVLDEVRTEELTDGE